MAARTSTRRFARPAPPPWHSRSTTRVRLRLLRRLLFAVAESSGACPLSCADLVSPIRPTILNFASPAAASPAAAAAAGRSALALVPAAAAAGDHMQVVAQPS